MKNATDITIVLDRSGSMETICDDTIGGFNAFLCDQRKLPDEARLTLVVFADGYDLVYEDKKIQEADLLSGVTYVPRGSTALLDAIGRAMNATGARLAKLPESARPSRVLFVILTDGEENASREFKRDHVARMIQHQRDRYRWEFAFLGAGESSFLQGKALGIDRGQSFVPNATGTGLAFNSISRGTSSYRSGGGYTP